MLSRPEAASLLLPVSVAFGNFMTGHDQTVVITALPDMGRSLGEDPAAMGLALTADAGSLTFLAAAGSGSVRLLLPPMLRRFGFRRVLANNTPLLAVAVAVFAMIQSSTPAWLIGSLIFVFGVFRSIQWGSTGNLAYAEVTPDQLARFSTLYHVLWQLAVAVSIGTAAALIAPIQGVAPHATTLDFRTALLLEGGVTLSALIAYWRLMPEDGQAVSGHAGPKHMADQSLCDSRG